MKKIMLFFLLIVLNIFGYGLVYGDLFGDLSKHAENVKKQSLRLKKKVEDVVGKENVKTIEGKAKEQVGKLSEQAKEKLSGKKKETQPEVSETETVQEQSATEYNTEAIQRNPSQATY